MSTIYVLINEAPTDNKVIAVFTDPIRAKKVATELANFLEVTIRESQLDPEIENFYPYVCILAIDEDTIEAEYKTDVPLFKRGSKLITYNDKRCVITSGISEEDAKETAYRVLSKIKKQFSNQCLLEK